MLVQILKKWKIGLCTAFSGLEKEVVSFFSTFQSPNRMLSGMDELDPRFNVSDSSKSALRLLCGGSQRVSLFLEHIINREDMPAVTSPSSTPGLLVLIISG